MIPLFFPVFTATPSHPITINLLKVVIFSSIVIKISFDNELLSITCPRYILFGSVNNVICSSIMKLPVYLFCYIYIYV